MIKNFYLLVLSIFLFLSAKGQDKITVHGTITDECTGEPIPFVNVLVKGTKKAVLADFNGDYLLEARPDDVLEFTFIGYEPYSVIVGERKIINVTIREINNDLGLYESTIGHITYHTFIAAGTYSKQGLGYTAGYIYSPGYAFPQTKFQLYKNYFNLGLQISDTKPSNNDLLFNTFFRLDISRFFVLKVLKNYFQPFVDAGYYIDTDFNRVTRNNLSIGGGLKWHTKIIRPKPFIVYLHVGYNGFINNSKNNYFYAGILLRTKTPPILIY